MLDQDLLNMERKYKNSKTAVRIIILFLAAVGIAALYFLINKYIDIKTFILIAAAIVCSYVFAITSHNGKEKALKGITEICALKEMGFQNWPFEYSYDTSVSVKSAQSVYKYDDIKYFKENTAELKEAGRILDRKTTCAATIRRFLENNEFSELTMYWMVENKANKVLKNMDTFNILVEYTSPAGRSHEDRIIPVTSARLNKLTNDKTLLMTKGEYSKYVKEQEKEKLENKKHEFYEKINKVIDLASERKGAIIIKGDIERMDDKILSLLDKAINSIRKVKTAESEEWETIDIIVSDICGDIEEIIEKNKRLSDYYSSQEFDRTKAACDALMSSQREFNEYIEEKVDSIAGLFGTRIIRNETINEDEFAYIHPYKKSISPFSAEVSASVFASAENKPLEYIVKSFYPDKERYPEQIQKLQLLIEELETLKDAKKIIDNYKAQVQQYLTEVPSYVLDNDSDGFYARLGFAIINENTLNVEYKFAYTSGAGKAQRSFSVPMTEETIIELIKTLESRLTTEAFTKEQRSMMTAKLRQFIKERDSFTCQICGNSTYKEPNLLLEIDHIIPIAKGGYTEENNLQTLCWKCNRQKGSKLG